MADNADCPVTSVWTGDNSSLPARMRGASMTIVKIVERSCSLGGEACIGLSRVAYRFPASYTVN